MQRLSLREALQECMLLHDKAFNRSLGARERLPKLKRLKDLREQIGLPTKWDIMYGRRAGSATKVTVRIYDREIELLDSELKIKTQFDDQTAG